jgi:hypothetical protein
MWSFVIVRDQATVNFEPSTVIIARDESGVDSEVPTLQEAASKAELLAIADRRSCATFEPAPGQLIAARIAVYFALATGGIVFWWWVFASVVKFAGWLVR